RVGRRADGRRRSSCREASLESEAAEALREIAANGLYVLAAGEAAAAPGAGARGERLELVGLRWLPEGAPDSAPHELGPRSAGHACDPVEELELVASQVDLRPSHGVTIHHYVAPTSWAEDLGGVERCLGPHAGPRTRSSPGTTSHTASKRTEGTPTQ